MTGPLTLGYATIGALILVLGFWGGQARISGAVNAPGTFATDGMGRTIQHAEGGVILEIHATDGDEVSSGDLLYRLDDTGLRADLGIVRERLLDLSARLYWLEGRKDAPHDDALRALFDAETRARAEQMALLAAQQDQIGLQIRGLSAQHRALEKQARIIAAQLIDLRLLFDRGLADAGRLRALERAEAETQGDIGKATAAIAEGRARISQLDLQAVQAATDHSAQRERELRETRSAIAELTSRAMGLEARLARMRIHAPVSGTLYGTTVFGTGTVIASGAPLVHLVPSDRSLIVSAFLQPRDAGRVRTGQPASLSLTDADTPGPIRVTGHVSQVAAAATPHPATGAPVYKVLIVPDPGAFHGLTDRLRPGQPVQGFIRTGDRTPLEYLVQPFTRYVEQAWREP